MDRFSRIVLGYHGCDPQFVDDLLAGRVSGNDWRPSANPYDWLGEGIYFWEHAPARARDWMGRGAVIGAVIQRGTCLDLTDTEKTDLLAEHYAFVKDSYDKKGLALPSNHGRDGKLRDLDCLVINSLIDSMELRGVRFQTVRSPFLEGDPAFPGSRILKENHIQIAVRDQSCIPGVFRPYFS